MPRGNDPGQTHYVGDDCPGGHKDMEAILMPETTEEMAAAVAAVDCEYSQDVPGRGHRPGQRCTAVSKCISP